MHQPGFFDYPNESSKESPNPHNGTPTSRHASQAMTKTQSRIDKTRILDYLCARISGATRDEIEVDLKIGGNTVRPRVAELLKDGKIEECNDVRKTRSGRNAAVLRACKTDPPAT